MAGALPANRGNRSSNRVGATVSRRLRAAGFNVSPSARCWTDNGMFVRGVDGRATITVDFGIPVKNDRVVCELLDELFTWPQVTCVDYAFTQDGEAVLVWVDYTPA